MSNFNMGFLRAVKKSLDETFLSVEKKCAEELKKKENFNFNVHEDMHKIQGVFKMIGLDGCSIFAKELELFSKKIIELSGKEKQSAILLLKDSVLKISKYLDDLLDGEKDIPAKLFMAYKKIKMMNGDHRVSAGDFFFPNLDSAFQVEKTELSDENVISLAKDIRGKFQFNLIKWMKDPSILRDMAQHMETMMRDLQVGSRADFIVFWKISRAWFSVLKTASVDAVHVNEIRPLLTKIDNEIKNFADLSSRVNQEASRALLYILAQEKDTSNEWVKEIKNMFGLGAYWMEMVKAMNESESLTQSIDTAEMKNLIKECKDDLVKTFNGSQTHVNENKWVKSCEKLAQDLAIYQNPSIKKIMDSMVLVARKVFSKELKLTDAIAEEIAFMLVFIEVFIEKRGKWAPEKDKQAETQIKRLSMAIKGQIDGLKNLKFEIDSAMKNENERILMSKILSEIKKDIHKIEDVFDLYFRTHGENKDDIKSLIKIIENDIGVVDIWGFKKAANILSELLQVVKSNVDAEKMSEEDIKKITNGFGGLELYFESSFEKGSSDEVLINKLIQVLSAGVMGDFKVLDIDLNEMNKEIPVINDVTKEEPLVNEEEQIINVTHEPLKDSLTSSVMDFEINESGEIEAKEIPVLTLMDSKDEIVNSVQDDRVLVHLDKEKDSELVNDLLAAEGENYVGEESQIVHLSEGSIEKINQLEMDCDDCIDFIEDDELGEIFIAEARELIDLSKDLIESEKSGNHAEDFVLQIKRIFHTIKGSGRMVKLMNIGEFGFILEKYFTNQMELNVAPSQSMFDLINFMMEFLNERTIELEENKKTKVNIEHIKARLENEKQVQVQHIDIEVKEPALDFEVEPSLEVSVEEVKEPALDFEVEPSLEVSVEEVKEPALDFEVEPSLEVANEDEMLVLPETEAVEIESSGLDPWEEGLQNEGFDIDHAKEDVHAKDVQVDPELMDIFKMEMKLHKEVFEGFFALDGVEKVQFIKNELMRAVHTVGSISYAVHAILLGDIAKKIELFSENDEDVIESCEKILSDLLLKMIEYVNRDCDYDWLFGQKEDILIALSLLDGNELKVIDEDEDEDEDEDDIVLIEETQEEIEKMKVALSGLQEKLSKLLTKLKMKNE